MLSINENVSLKTFNTFKIDIISYDGDNSWMEDTIIKIKNTLESSDIPEGNKNCIHCKYRGVN